MSLDGSLTDTTSESAVFQLENELINLLENYFLNVSDDCRSVPSKQVSMSDITDFLEETATVNSYFAHSEFIKTVKNVVEDSRFDREFRVDFLQDLIAIKIQVRQATDNLALENYYRQRDGLPAKGGTATANPDASASLASGAKISAKTIV